MAEGGNLPATDQLQRQLEALIFAAAEPVAAADLQKALTELFEVELPESMIDAGLQGLQQRYVSPEFAFELVQLAGSYQFLTKALYQRSIGLLLKHTTQKRLSRSALETLSIIAYKQPVSRSELEQVRGVNCDYAIKKLLERELIEIRGKG